MLEKLLPTNQIQAVGSAGQCRLYTATLLLQVVFSLELTTSETLSGSLWPQNKMSSDQKSLKTSSRYICQEVKKKISAL